MTPCVIRPARPEELPVIRQLVVESFSGVTLEQNVEEALGILNGHDWRWRKARHVDEDHAVNPAGVFVAELNSKFIGCITTRLDRECGKGRIPNLSVLAEYRGEGLGRRLIEHAIEYFRQEDMEYAMIETMAQNQAGQHLYPACGFVEVARQVHYAQKLPPKDTP